MGVKWDVLNKQADDARLARQEREKRAKEAKAAEEERERRAQEAIAQGARPESQKRRAFTILIDEVVAAGVRKGLDGHKMHLVEQWAINLKARLGLNEGQSVHSALFTLRGESTAIMMISNMQNAIEHGGRDSLTDGGTVLSRRFQPGWIVGFIEREVHDAEPTQHSLGHSSRINGRHARILGVETRGQANGGGYWL